MKAWSVRALHTVFDHALRPLLPHDRTSREGDRFAAATVHTFADVVALVKEFLMTNGLRYDACLDVGDPTAVDAAIRNPEVIAFLGPCHHQATAWCCITRIPKSDGTHGSAWRDHRSGMSLAQLRDTLKTSFRGVRAIRMIAPTHDPLPPPPSEMEEPELPSSPATTEEAPWLSTEEAPVLPPPATDDARPGGSKKKRKKLRFPEPFESLTEGERFEADLLDAYIAMTYHPEAKKKAYTILYSDVLSEILNHEDLEGSKDARAIVHEALERCSVVFMPLYQPGHWILCVLVQEEDDRPTILILDSAADEPSWEDMCKRRNLKHLRRALDHTTEDRWQCRAVPCAQQKVGSRACGMYVLKNLEVLTALPEGWWSPDRWDDTVERLEAVTPGDIRNMRQNVYDVLKDVDDITAFVVESKASYERIATNAPLRGELSNHNLDKYIEIMYPPNAHMQVYESALYPSFGNASQNPSNRFRNSIKKFRTLYIPVLRGRKGGHWVLLAVVPEQHIVYTMDSIGGTVTGEAKEVMRVLNATETTKPWKHQVLKNATQKDSESCGFFVLVFLEVLVSLGDWWKDIDATNAALKAVTHEDVVEMRRKVACTAAIWAANEASSSMQAHASSDDNSDVQLDVSQSAEPAVASSPTKVKRKNQKRVLPPTDMTTRLTKKGRRAGK